MHCSRAQAWLQLNTSSLNCRLFGRILGGYRGLLMCLLLVEADILVKDTVRNNLPARMRALQRCACGLGI